MPCKLLESHGISVGPSAHTYLRVSSFGNLTRITPMQMHQPHCPLQGNPSRNTAARQPWCNPKPSPMQPGLNPYRNLVATTRPVRSFHCNPNATSTMPTAPRQEPSAPKICRGDQLHRHKRPLATPAFGEEKPSSPCQLSDAEEERLHAVKESAGPGTSSTGSSPGITSNPSRTVG